MKWIGQHIWDFISRFRNDIYLENITDSAQNKVVGIDDTTGKLYKFDTPTGGGGGSVTINGNEEVTNITFSGVDINVIETTEGSVTIFSPPANYTDDLSIVNSGHTIDNLSSYTIGVPNNTNNFFAGSYAGGSHKVTDSASHTFTSYGKFGNAQNGEKIIVEIYGPDEDDNTSDPLGDGSDTPLGSLEYTIDDNLTSSGSGITITLTNREQDLTVDRMKANLTVTFNPSTLANTGTGYTGSQMYNKVRIRHTNSSDTNHTSPFNSPAFFYDNRGNTPSAAADTPTVNSTKDITLSNIHYHNEFTVGVTGTISNLNKDTSTGYAGECSLIPLYNSYSYDPVEDFDISKDNNDSEGTTNVSESKEYDNRSNYFSTKRSWRTDITPHGGIGGNGSLVESTVSGNFCLNTFDPDDLEGTYASSDGVEKFYTEIYRLPHSTVGTWNTMGATLQSLQSASLGGSGSLSTATPQVHCVQRRSGGSMKLFHPYNLSLGSSPSQPDFDGWTSLSTGTTVYYYRYFYFNDATSGNYTLTLGNMTRAAYGQEWDNDRLKIYLCQPGQQTTWTPLDPDVNYNQAQATNSCNWGYHPASDNAWNITFADTGMFVAIKIELKSTNSLASGKINSITMGMGHN